MTLAPERRTISPTEPHQVAPTTRRPSRTASTPACR